MDAGFFGRGLAIGFSIAAPVGPIGVLCIRRTLSDGMRTGLVAGLGAATADAAYGAIAGFGLSSVSGLLVRQEGRLELCGGAFLCYLGLRTFFAAPAAEAPWAGPTGAVGTTGAGGPAASDMPVRRTVGPAGVYVSTLFLTFSNPSTILSFVAVFAGLGLGAAPDRLAAGVLVGGVFLGSALWWLILSTGIGLLRSRVTAAWMLTINRFAGCILFAFGLYAVARGLLGWIDRIQP